MWIREIRILILFVGIACWHTTFCSKAEFSYNVVDVVDTHRHSFLLCSLQTLDGLLLWTDFSRGYTTVFMFDRALGGYFIRGFSVVECVDCLVGFKLCFEATMFRISVGWRWTTISAVETKSAILEYRFRDSGSILVGQSYISDLNQSWFTLRHFWVLLSPCKHRRKICLLLFRLCYHLSLPFLIPFYNRCWLKLRLQLRLTASLIVLLYPFCCNHASFRWPWS